MTENTYILAVDPGNEKTGVAIVTPDGSMSQHYFYEYLQ